MLTCDWCKCPIKGDEQIGYSIEALPFRPLNIAGQGKGADKPTIVSELHVHALCRRNLLWAIDDLVKDHEPTPEELDADLTLDPDEIRRKEHGEGVKERKVSKDMERRDAWQGLPRHEQDRRVLEVFEGTEKLLNPEIVERLRAKDDEEAPYFTQDVGIVTNRLYKAGELEKEHGTWDGCRVRYKRSEPSAELRRLAEQFEKGQG